MKSYFLNEIKSKRLGDKTEYYYDFQEDMKVFRDEIIDAVKGVIEGEGLTAGEILEDPKRLEKYETIRKQTGLTAGRRQEDIYLFIEKILEIIRANSAE